MEAVLEKFISLATGVQMEYVEQGPAVGVAMVFLHGVTDSWHSFERVPAEAAADDSCVRRLATRAR